MLGSNVPTIGGIEVGFRYADIWDCDCIQIYTTLSRRWDVPELNTLKIKAFKDAWKKSSVKKVVAHVPFLVNLSSEKAEIREKSIKRLAVEISRACDLEISSLVLHPGSCGTQPKQKGIKQIISGIQDAFSTTDSNYNGLALETMSGQGTSLGSNFYEIAEILEGINIKNQVGVCLDTAHIFEAGYNFVGYQGYHDVFNEFDKVIGLRNLKVIHLNDSMTPMHSHIDRHCNIGEGNMGMQVFHALITDKKNIDIPKILEIPEREEKSRKAISDLRKLAKIQSKINEKSKIPYQLKFTYNEKLMK